MPFNRMGGRSGILAGKEEIKKFHRLRRNAGIPAISNSDAILYMEEVAFFYLMYGKQPKFIPFRMIDPVTKRIVG